MWNSSGFWSRLITRILADDTIVEIVMSFLTPFKDFVDDKIFAALLETHAEWVLWQTGIELRYAGITLLRLKEVNYSFRNSPHDYRFVSFFIICLLLITILHLCIIGYDCYV